MPVYEYWCRNCGAEREVARPFDQYRYPVQCACGGRMTRVISGFCFQRSMEGHYNLAVGQYVSNERELRDSLKVASERATIRTGVEHRFVPVDLRDKERLNVTEEGLDETMKVQTDSGQREAKRWL